MRIYRMTATFGKLEHETLTLEPGLNIITAPNEWGKSTWSAFLVAMLYGLDTRAKTTKNALSDKEHYAPWSGSPMAGRIDLNWNGRDITIERRTKKRIPLGEFQAYETASGLPVTELSAVNCGQMLLGVEQSVFRRTGFIRNGDLPVTQDEALRRRLNALVTTGDESAAADRLAVSLKDLKNRCRYNRTGLLPQAEAERDALDEKIAELENLDFQSKKLRMRLDEIKGWLSQLHNHRQALAYAAAEANAARVAQARDALRQQEQELQEREAECDKLPSREEAEQKLRELRSMTDQWNAIQMEYQLLPEPPKQPQLLAPFEGMTADTAREMAQSDAAAFASAANGKLPFILVILSVVCLMAAAGLVFVKEYLYAGIAGVVGLLLLVWGIVLRGTAKKRLQMLFEKYGDGDYAHWVDTVDDYEQAMQDYEQELKEHMEIRGDVEVRMMVQRKRLDTLSGSRDVGVQMEHWQQILEQWDAYHTARRETLRAQNHVQTLGAMMCPVEKPAMPDHLTHSEADTSRLLLECAAEQQRLQNRLGQYQGRMEALGDKQQLLEQRNRKAARIAKLEETYGALTIAQEALAAATEELQRRFAPRITKRAQELLSAMTAGRYRNMTISKDFSLQTGAADEDTLRDSFWRSDGTMDQLYLALRLAVAEELTPEAPLILDDALVRFDDSRMKAAVAILEEMAKNKQVILFTCQGREKIK